LEGRLYWITVTPAGNTTINFVPNALAAEVLLIVILHFNMSSDLVVVTGRLAWFAFALTTGTFFIGPAGLRDKAPILISVVDPKDFMLNIFR